MIDCFVSFMSIGSTRCTNNWSEYCSETVLSYNTYTVISCCWWMISRIRGIEDNFAHRDRIHASRPVARSSMCFSSRCFESTTKSLSISLGGYTGTSVIQRGTANRCMSSLQPRLSCLPGVIYDLLGTSTLQLHLSTFAITISFSCYSLKVYFTYAVPP